MIALLPAVIVVAAPDRSKVALPLTTFSPCGAASTPGLHRIARTAPASSAPAAALPERTNPVTCLILIAHAPIEAARLACLLL